jgi:hypothetical protein
MLVYSFGTENDIPWKGITIDNMEDSGEDLAKAFAFPAENEWAHWYELFAVETDADGLVVDGHVVGHMEPVDGLECDKVVDFASGIESHLGLNVVTYMWGEYLDSLQKRIIGLLRVLACHSWLCGNGL